MRDSTPESGAKRMNEAEIEAHFHQAESELDRVRRQLERKRVAFQRLGNSADPQRDVIVKQTSKLLEQYHAAEREAELWAGLLEACRDS